MDIGLFNGPEIVEKIKRVPNVDGSVSLGSAYSAKYAGIGPGTVIDGIRGSYDFTDGNWQGFEGVDFTATLDLGRSRTLSMVWAGFLQQQGGWIFMPESVEYAVSDNGKEFRSVGIVTNTLNEKDEGTVIRDFTAKFTKTNARYIRINATNRKLCPSWHPGAGEKAWIFVDEVGMK
jgi:hexosaminidase